MAYMGRGSTPSIGNNQNGNFYGGIYRYRRSYYYNSLDSTYVIMEMIATFIILIVGFISYIATYKSNIIDPIENIKNLFINTNLIIIGSLLTITLIINFFTEEKSKLLKRLIIMAFISIISSLVFLGIRLDLDSKYNEIKFDKFYEEQKEAGTTEKKNIIDIGLNKMSLKTEKEYYISECTKLYDIFKVKSLGTLTLQLILILLLVYQILRIRKIQNKREKMNKDDLILFDEEENIKL